jgi:hypothetical protein
LTETATKTLKAIELDEKKIALEETKLLHPTA